MNIVRILIAIVLTLIVVQMVHSHSLLKRPDISHFAEVRINYLITRHNAIADCLKASDLGASDIHQACEQQVNESLGPEPSRSDRSTWQLP
ncbi:MAG: hypothetical protein WAV92_00970 [Halopseudomonas yangmingensis]|uniref:Uncharacterized protein n=1 Tax=Halopseudomonas yangmingensis TaxID=1720063 RepID=A0A1I4PUB0_9GAMM|nr:hypothetical protein [Halopseudomonas yangmingensis]SFM31442.1 hypothetical protein SAMN05216217_103100 [Halopseudomonas yangmingensis]